MDLDVVFLGTAGSAPTARRGASATLLRHGGERVLVDCAEGTQRQLLRSDVGLIDLEHIFFTHLHADHVLGLPGLLKTYALRDRTGPVALYGPSGLRRLLDTFAPVLGRLPYEVVARELEAGEEVAFPQFTLASFPVAHGTVRALGFALREPGRPGAFDVERADALGVPAGKERGALQRGEVVVLADGSQIQPSDVLGEARRGRTVVLTGDTAPCASVVEAATDADLLVHEATFLAEERGRARETGHSTAGEAALAAREAGVAMLALTHLSARYGGQETEAEARELFPNTVVPRDFDLIRIPFPERGAPEHIVRGARVPRQRTADVPASETISET